MNLSSSSRKNDCGLLNRAFVQVQSEKMSYRKMPSHFRPPAPVSPAATPARELEVQPLSLLGTKLRRNAVRPCVGICTPSGLLAPSFGDAEAVASHHSSLPSVCKPALLWGSKPRGSSERWPTQPWISSWEPASCPSPSRSSDEEPRSKVNLPLPSEHSSGGQQQVDLFSLTTAAL